jgi:outer membrane protein assembly factor BamA
MSASIRAGLVAALLISSVAAAAAQEPPSPPAAPPPEAAPDRAVPTAVAVPTRDVFDLVRALRHKPPKVEEEDYRKLMLAAAPVVGYNPASGLSAGVAGNAAFYKGYPETTSISSLVASLVATTKSQVLFNGKLEVSTPHNTWVFRGDNRLYWTSQDTYGLGTATTPDDGINARYDFFRFYETLFREVRGHLFLGAGFLYNVHRDVRPAEESEAAWPTSPYVAYSELFGFDLQSQTSAGARASAAWDSRDSAINPSRGLYATLDYQMFFEGFLGGTSTWQELDTELRTYVRLSRDARHRLAFWLFADMVTGGHPPYFDLPATSMDTYGRSGRGYVQGRFRGQRLAYGEVEYRVTLRKDGLLGAVAFLNTQTFSNEQSGEKLFDSFATGGGVGLRLMMNKRSKTNLAFDVGWGRDGSNVYFAVQEAF